jgi:uncharacterized membrane protein
MNLRQSLLWQGAALAGTLVADLLIAPQLGDRVPIHWGIDGKPDGWGNPAFLLALGPGLVLFMMVLTLVIPWLPGGKAVGGFISTYARLMAVLAGFFALLHGVILVTAGRGDSMPGAFMALMMGLFVLLGPMMRDVKPNPYVGIRTPWTLGDPEVWVAAHRRAAALYFWGGLVGAILALAGAPMGLSIGILLVLALAPILDSYLLSRTRVGKAD